MLKILYILGVVIITVLAYKNWYLKFIQTRKVWKIYNKHENLLSQPTPVWLQLKQGYSI